MTIISVISLLSAIITIFVFLTGKYSISDVFNKNKSSNNSDKKPYKENVSKPQSLKKRKVPKITNKRKVPTKTKSINTQPKNPRKIFPKDNAKIYIEAGGNLDIGKNFVLLSKDGQVIVSGSRNNRTLHIWDRYTGTKIRSWKGHENPIIALALSPDCNTIVSASYNEPVRLWDINSGDKIRELKTFSAAIKAAAFSTDGQFIILGENGQVVQILDIETGKELMRFNTPIPMGEVISLAFNSEGQAAIIGSHNNLTVWNTRTGKEIVQHSFGNYYILAASFSPDDQTVTAISSDSSIRLVDFSNTGRILKHWKSFRRNSIRYHDTVSAAISSDCQISVFSDGSDTIYIWDKVLGWKSHRIKIFPAAVISVAFDRDTKTIIAGDYRGRFYILDYTKRDLVLSAIVYAFNDGEWLTHTTKIIILAHQGQKNTLIFMLKKENSMLQRFIRNTIMKRWLPGHSKSPNN